jgi:hypothetical protein
VAVSRKKVDEEKRIIVALEQKQSAGPAGGPSTACDSLVPPVDNCGEDENMLVKSGVQVFVFFGGQVVLCLVL